MEVEGEAGRRRWWGRSGRKAGASRVYLIAISFGLLRVGLLELGGNAKKSLKFMVLCSYLLFSKGRKKMF